MEEGLYIPVNVDFYSSEDNINTNIKLKNCVINEPIDNAEFTIGVKQR